MKKAFIKSTTKTIGAKKYKLAISLLIVGGLLFVQSSCKKDPPAEPAKPVISTVKPDSAKVGESITITGTNFKDNKTGVSVMVGDKSATVSSAALTSIVCAVPAGVPVGAATVKVTVDTRESTVYNGFKVYEENVVPPVKISGFTPDTGRYGQVVTFTGEKFGTDATKIEVKINGKTQTITEITDTQLKIELQKKTFSGKVEISKDGKTVKAGKDFTYFEQYRFGSYLGTITGIDIAIDSKDNLYVADISNDAITQLNSQGTILQTIKPDTGRFQPHGIYIEPNDDLYIADAYWGIIYSYSAGSKLEIVMRADTLIDGISFLSKDKDSDNTLYTGGSYNKNILTIDIPNKTRKSFYTYNSAAYSILIKETTAYFTALKEIARVDLDGTNFKTIITSDDYRYTKLIEGVNGDIYVINKNTAKISILANDSLSEIVDLNVGGKTITNVRSMAIDSKGDIYFIALSNDPGLIKVIVE